MNQNDPMKGNTSSEDQTRSEHIERQEQSDAYTAADGGYSYRADEAADGRGYTNPDGTHGFIYQPDSDSDDRYRYAARSRNRRGAVIALCAVMATLIIGAGCFFGAYMAAKSLYTAGENPPSDQGSGEEVTTSNGLVIRDDSNDEESDAGAQTEADTSADTGASGKPEDESKGSADQMGVVTTPSTVTIHKTPAERDDTDGNGRAEIETDENGQVLTSAGKDALSVATVVHRVAASVVEITTETINQSGYIGQYITSGAGSGVIIASEGYVVTNHHVIDGASTITVRLTDGTEFTATLVGTDEMTDIAVLKIDPGEYVLTVATLGCSFDLVVGEEILAIGNPLGSLGGTVTEGMISATAREINVSGVDMTLLQVSAPINPGNSGGGLFNLAGELVGVVNAKMSSEEIEGLGFAIPIDTAYEVIQELIAYGYVRGRPTLDFTVVDMMAMTAYQYFGVRMAGVYVYDDQHEIMQYGDLILSADGAEVTSVSALENLIRNKQVGDTLELTVYRQMKTITVTVTVVEKTP